MVRTPYEKLFVLRGWRPQSRLASPSGAERSGFNGSMSCRNRALNLCNNRMLTPQGKSEDRRAGGLAHRQDTQGIKSKLKEIIFEYLPFSEVCLICWPVTCSFWVGQARLCSSPYFRVHRIHRGQRLHYRRGRDRIHLSRQRHGGISWHCLSFAQRRD